MTYHTHSSSPSAFAGSLRPALYFLWPSKKYLSAEQHTHPNNSRFSSLEKISSYLAKT